MSGQLIGVGTGPGDPELITLKAVNALARADVVAHFAKRGHVSNARTIAAAHIGRKAVELPLLYPVTTEIPKDDPAYKKVIQDFYEESARTVEEHLAAGHTVVVLSEGDPLFFGSYMHLHVRLAHLYPTEVVAGITAMSGCWSAVGLPIAQGDDVLSVLPGTLPESELARRMDGADAAIIMKVGRNLPKIRRALETAGKLGEAVFVERGTMEAMVTMPLSEKPNDKAAYFSIVLVPGWRGQEINADVADHPGSSPGQALSPALRQAQDEGEESLAAMKGAHSSPPQNVGERWPREAGSVRGSPAEEIPQAKANHLDETNAAAADAPASPRTRP